MVMPAKEPPHLAAQMPVDGAGLALGGLPIVPSQKAPLGCTRASLERVTGIVRFDLTMAFKPAVGSWRMNSPVSLKSNWRSASIMAIALAISGRSWTIVCPSGQAFSRSFWPTMSNQNSRSRQRDRSSALLPVRRHDR
jgi:hypothetical protein